MKKIMGEMMIIKYKIEKADINQNQRKKQKCGLHKLWEETIQEKLK